MTKRKSVSKDNSRFKLLIFGTIGTMLLFLIICFALSLLAYAINDPLGIIGITSLLSLILCAVISGYVLSRKGGESGAITSILSSLLFSLIMLLTGLIISGGKMPISCLFNYLIYMATASLFAYFGRKKAKRTKRRLK